MFCNILQLYPGINLSIALASNVHQVAAMCHVTSWSIVGRRASWDMEKSVGEDANMVLGLNGSNTIIEERAEFWS